MQSERPVRRLRTAGIAAAIILVVVVAGGVAARVSHDSNLREWTEEQATPTVAIVTPSAEAMESTLELPGRLEAQSRAPLYARVSGYLKSWNADIGTRVKAGQLLAVIEAPDVEQQLLQAEADLVSAKANASLAESTAKRWQSMMGTDSVSKQEVEERVGDYAVKQAMVNAAQANVNRLRTMQQFTRIVAPFDGVVTARETDVGALINAGGGTGPELFVVSDTRRLRLYVNVPQVYAAMLSAGMKAQVAVPERAGTRYEATIESTSGAVNTATGTTLVQLALDNAKGDLLPGGFANVSFDLPKSSTTLRIPASALIFDQHGLRVATVGEGNKVTLKPITIARDHGASVEVATGLGPDDRVIETPPDGIVDGTLVRIMDQNAKVADARS
jgi:RND family efflux transporter MFP subunit